MEKESRGDETEDGEEILAVQLKAEKSRQSYADFLRKIFRSAGGTACGSR